MSKSATNRLIGSNGLIRVVVCRNVRNLNSNSILRCSTRQSPSANVSTNISASTNTPTSMTSKINVLLNEMHRSASSSRMMLIDNGKSLLRRQRDAFIAWYDEISHTNEIREAHKQVEHLQDKLNQAQQLRRDVSKDLNDIRYKLQMCYADQVNCHKGDPRYLELIRREIEVSWLNEIEAKYRNSQNYKSGY